MDVQGINYNYKSLDAFHRSHPLTPIINSETAACTCARGTYVTNATSGHQSQYNCVSKACLGGYTLEQGWTELASREYMMGGMFWSGFDYLGEPAPYSWPERNSNWGIHDMAGFRKDMFYYYQSVWTTQPMLHLFPHWNWEGLLPNGAGNVSVWCYTNADSVELSLNGASLGRQAVPPMGHVEWEVPFAAGELTAVGYKSGARWANATVATAKEAHRISLEVVVPSDHTLRADGQDAALVAATIVDSDGVAVPDASDLVTFTASGRAAVVGVSNGDPASHEPIRAATHSAFHGKVAAVVQSSKVEEVAASSTVTVVASAPGLQQGTVTLTLADSR